MAADTPFRLLLLGDFSGRGNRGESQAGAELASRKTIHVDRDNFDQVINRLGVRLTETIVDSQNQPVSVQFSELDDFEPDQLFESVSLFDSLRTLRQQLMNESTFAQAAAEVRSWMQSDTSPPSASGGSNAAEQVSLDDIVNAAHSSPQPNSTRWDEMIGHLVAPLIVDGPDPERDDLVACVDAAISESMRRLLHHPAFQRTEAAWRGVNMLTRRLETGGDLQIHLLDVSRQEITQDLQGDVSQSAVYRLIVEQSVGTSGAQPWAAVFGCDTFCPDVDAGVLHQLARISEAAGAPFIAGVTGEAVGCPNPDRTSDPDDWQPSTCGNAGWQELLNSGEASFLELLWPRFRCRLPYGRESRRIDAFDFEELPAESAANHEDYLWCSPAFAAALALGQAFSHYGWDMRPGELDQVDDLPLCYRPDEDNEPVALPCGELWLTDRGANKIRQHGISPVLSVKGQAAIRLGNFNSINGEPLMGPWC